MKGFTVSRRRLSLLLAACLSIPCSAQAGARLPERALGFEPNVGQTDPQARFLSRGAGYTLWLTETAAVLRLATARDAPGNIVRLSLLDSRPAASIEGEDAMAGHSHYLIGAASGWQRNLPLYRRVRYASVYPGIDWVIHGNPGDLEYDFVVQPGADPADIRLHIEGVERIEVSGGGDLLLQTAHGVLRQRRPVLYQTVAGTRRAVSGRYRVDGATVAFDVGAYAADLPLVIDPVLDYSTYFGSPESDYGGSITLDRAGNIYLTGYTPSASFPAQSGYDMRFGGYTDAFITKLNAAGDRIIYSTYLGGSGVDSAVSIAVDGQGRALIGGTTESADFPVPNGLQRRFGGGLLDVFVAMLNAAGNGLIYGSYLGGSGYDSLGAIALGTDGSVYVGGYTDSLDFPTYRAMQRRPSAYWDGFVSRIRPNGSGFIYSTYLGGNGLDLVQNLAVDSSGAAYAVGTTSSVNFPVVNAFQPAYGGGYDGYISKLTPDGGALAYSSFIGGSSMIEADREGALAVVVDAQGRAYIGGDTNSDDFPTPGFGGTFGGGGDAFVGRVSADGTHLEYARYVGGSAQDCLRSLALSGQSLYLAGCTHSADFPRVNSVQAYAGGSDAYVTQISLNSGAIVGSTLLGGSGDDYGQDLVVRGGRAFLLGNTTSRDFPVRDAMKPVYEGADGSVEMFLSILSGFATP